MIVKFHDETFAHPTSSKEAYLTACKWVASNVVSKEVEIGETLVKYAKVSGASLPTVKVELYALLDTAETSNSFCSKCKEFHANFYVNEDFNCATCKHTAFISQMDKRLAIKRQHRKEKLGRILSSDE
jgi:hypothetical protein